MESPLQIKIQFLTNFPPEKRDDLAVSTVVPLYAAIEESRVIELDPLDRAVVPLGIALQMHTGVEGKIVTHGARSDLKILNEPGTIDPDYRGEVMAIVVNLSLQKIVINRGDRIGSLLFSRFARVALEEI